MASPQARRPLKRVQQAAAQDSPAGSPTAAQKKAAASKFRVKTFDFTQALPVASFGTLKQAEVDKKYKPYEVFDRIDPVLTQSIHRSHSPGAPKLITTTGMHREGKVELPQCHDIVVDFSESALTKKQKRLVQRNETQKARHESLAENAQKQVSFTSDGVRVRPYDVQRKNVFEDPMMRYQPDGDDMTWCATRDVTLPNLIDIFTLLEVNYVQYIVNHVRSVERSEAEGRRNAAERGGGRGSPTKKKESTKPRERCTICGELADENFCRCKKCHQLSHVECAMIDNKSLTKDRRWHCDACAAGHHPDDLRCKLCAKTGGLFVHIENSRQFAHVVCALLLPEGKVDENKREASFAPLDRKRDTLSCNICNVSGGACVECAHPRCHHGLHPTCAATSGFVERRSEQGGAVHAFCKDHYSDYSSLVIPNHLRILTCGSDLGKDSEREALAVTRNALRDDDDDLGGDFDDVAEYWKKKRQQTRRRSERVAEGINKEGEAMVTRIEHPAVLRLGGSTNAVRCSRFLCLIPAFQYHLSALLEGAVPQLEEHSAAPAKTTRSSGNNRQLVEKMGKLEAHIHNLTSIAHNVKRREQLKSELIATDLTLLEQEFFASGDVESDGGESAEVGLPAKRKRR